MILIIDGPRASGKSTMVDLIAGYCGNESIPFEIFKHQRGNDPFQDMLDSIERFNKEWRTIHICDRFSMTEYVFSIYHKRVPLGFLIQRITEINKELEHALAIHVILQTSTRLMEQRMLERPIGRTWDMLPPEAVNLVWTAAMGIAPGAVLLNNDDENDKMSIFRYIVRQIAFHRMGIV